MIQGYSETVLINCLNIGRHGHQFAKKWPGGPEALLKLGDLFNIVGWIPPNISFKSCAVAPPFPPLFPTSCFLFFFWLAFQKPVQT